MNESGMHESPVVSVFKDEIYFISVSNSLTINTPYELKVIRFLGK